MTDLRKPRESLSLAEARRVALAAQGFGVPRPERDVGIRDVQSVINRVAQFQVDSINVVTRAHYLPLFSRLGGYDPALLDRAAHRAPRRLFEYWGHAASLIDVTLQPCLRFRMAAAAEHAWQSMVRIQRERPEIVDHVRAEVAAHGPISARQLEFVEEVRDRSDWGWNWSAVKTALEWVFFTGEVTSAFRNSQFERVYDLTERVLPRSVVESPTPTDSDAIRTLVGRAARALGVASESCLRDYFRLGAQVTRTAINELVESGELRPVRVRGWDRPAWLWHRARVPRRVQAQALVSPFDSLVFERSRLESLFDFCYRIEIYVPQAQRQHGYYVYPFLLGEQFVARTDLKADRTAGIFRVQSAWLERNARPRAPEVAAALADELATLADWLGLGDVEVADRGDLAAELARQLALRNGA